MSGYCDSHDPSANVSAHNVQRIWCINGCCKSGALYICCENQLSPPVVEAASATVVVICAVIILSVIFVRFKCVRLRKLHFISPGSSTELTDTARHTQVTVIQHHNEETVLPPSYTSCVAVSSRDAQSQALWLTDLAESSSSRDARAEVVSSFPTRCLPMQAEESHVSTHGGTSVRSFTSSVSLPVTAPVPLGLSHHPSSRQYEWFPGQRRHSAIAAGGWTRPGSHFRVHFTADSQDPKQDPAPHQLRRLRANSMFVAASPLQDLRSRLLMRSPESSGFEPIQDEPAPHHPCRTRSGSVFLSVAPVHVSVLPGRTRSNSEFVVADSIQEDASQLPNRTRANSVFAEQIYTHGGAVHDLPRRPRPDSFLAGVRGSHDILQENPALTSRSCNFREAASHVIPQSVAGNNDTESVAQSSLLQRMHRTPFGDEFLDGVILQPLALTVYDASISSNALPTYEQVEEIMYFLDVMDAPVTQSDECAQDMSQIVQENVANNLGEVTLSLDSCELTESPHKTNRNCPIAELDASIPERGVSTAQGDIRRAERGMSNAQRDLSTLQSVDVSPTTASEDAVRTDAASQPPHTETNGADLESLPKIVLLLHGLVDVRSQHLSPPAAGLTLLSDSADIPPVPSVYSQGSDCPPPPPYTESDSAPPLGRSTQTITHL